jgi:hypothetical protein
MNRPSVAAFHVCGLPNSWRLNCRLCLLSASLKWRCDRLKSVGEFQSIVLVYT